METPTINRQRPTRSCLQWTLRWCRQTPPSQYRRFRPRSAPPLFSRLNHRAINSSRSSNFSSNSPWIPPLPKRCTCRRKRRRSTHRPCCTHISFLSSLSTTGSSQCRPRMIRNFIAASPRRLDPMPWTAQDIPTDWPFQPPLTVVLTPIPATAPSARRPTLSTTTASPPDLLGPRPGTARRGLRTIFTKQRFVARSQRTEASASMGPSASSRTARKNFAQSADTRATKPNYAATFQPRGVVHTSNVAASFMPHRISCPRRALAASVCHPLLLVLRGFSLHLQSLVLHPWPRINDLRISRRCKCERPWANNPNPSPFNQLMECSAGHRSLAWRPSDQTRLSLDRL